LGTTWDALVQGDRNRLRDTVGAIEQLTEDVSALRVTVHSLEDRVELELGAVQDEVRQAIAKSDELSAGRARAAEERLLNHLGWLAQASARTERRLNVLTGVAAFAALVWLFRC
jgi:hypothetical protein